MYITHILYTVGQIFIDAVLSLSKLSSNWHGNQCNYWTYNVFQLYYMRYWYNIYNVVYYPTAFLIHYP